MHATFLSCDSMGLSASAAVRTAQIYNVRHGQRTIPFDRIKTSNQPVNQSNNQTLPYRKLTKATACNNARCNKALHNMNMPFIIQEDSCVTCIALHPSWCQRLGLQDYRIACMLWQTLCTCVHHCSSGVISHVCAGTPMQQGCASISL